MKIRINPIAEGRRQSREMMLKSFPHLFSLVTDGDIALSNRSLNARCEVFIRPMPSEQLSNDKLFMEKLYGGLNSGTPISKIAFIGTCILLPIIVNHLATAKSATEAIVEFLILLFAARVNSGMLKNMAFIAETKKLSKSAIEAISKHPGGMPVYEIESIPSTSSDTRQ